MTITDETKQQLEDFRTDFALLKSEISKVIVGQSEILDDTILALVAGGHVLLEGCLLYTSPSPRDRQKSRMPSSA